MSRQRTPKPPDFQPEPGFPEGHRHHGKRRCQAWHPPLGRQCMQLAMRGRNVCWRCGGKTPRGLASPHTKTGEWSVDLPTRMVAGYLAALQDPDLIGLRKEIAVSEERVRDVLRRVDTKEAGELWTSIRRAIRDFRAAQRRDDAPSAASALRQMESLADEGVADYAAWGEAARWILVSVRLKEAERKRLEALHQFLTAEQALMYSANLLEAVRRSVDDPRTVQAIHREFERLNDRGAADEAYGR